MHNKTLMDYLPGEHSYVMYYMDVRQELSNLYLLQTKISAKLLAENDLKIFTLKCQKMNFYLYVFALLRTLRVFALLRILRKDFVN